MKMKTSIAHLPQQKIHELKRAVATILQFVKPQMIILFGSYARGDWVEDIDKDTLEFRNQSDFDLFVVMETHQQASQVEQNDRLSQRLLTYAQRTPVSVIAEDIAFINRRISNSQYFYIDIKREGIMLYDSGHFSLDEAKELTALERHHLAQEDFEYWFTKSNDFIDGFRFYCSQEKNCLAAFLLHQATESFYSAMLLVFTRYEPSYVITKEELEYQGERVEYLQALTERLCKAKIASYLQE